MIGCSALSTNQLQLILKTFTGRHALRNRALLMLGVRSGLCINELLALKVGQVWAGKKVVDRCYVRRQATKGKEAGASITKRYFPAQPAPCPASTCADPHSAEINLLRNFFGQFQETWHFDVDFNSTSAKVFPCWKRHSDKNYVNFARKKA
jgi:hypothetical protein